MRERYEGEDKRVLDKLRTLVGRPYLYYNPLMLKENNLIEAPYYAMFYKNQPFTLAAIRDIDGKGEGTFMASFAEKLTGSEKQFWWYRCSFFAHILREVKSEMEI
jgi:hypothetical protein